MGHQNKMEKVKVGKTGGNGKDSTKVYKLDRLLQFINSMENPDNVSKSELDTSLNNLLRPGLSRAKSRSMNDLKKLMNEEYVEETKTENKGREKVRNVRVTFQEEVNKTSSIESKESSDDMFDVFKWSSHTRQVAHNAKWTGPDVSTPQNQNDAGVQEDENSPTFQDDEKDLSTSLHYERRHQSQGRRNRRRSSMDTLGNGLYKW